VPHVPGVIHPAERGYTMRHPEVLYEMGKEHYTGLRHQAEVARGIRGNRKASKSLPFIDSLRVFLSSLI
jgi:hypothetical protein